ncbi:twitching motility protein PilU [Sulfuritortus calidifontis]|uniref:Twitching motility protein PilU n=1 Tax=Sulfuritortus calidifontis TaxID=1914471 RepID=A0A4R3K0E0_9PROT|nr:PilT/PilU family type 4a pilus ATPase [Sulfuritortus calidifontis]TCS73341.1 twitching motility protein PilU [Sulfuritortus calidifontis]
MKTDSQYFKFVAGLLKLMVDKGGSDLFVTVGAPPSIKLHGEMTPVNNTPVTREQAEELVASVMNDKQRQEFQETHECNWAISLEGIGRFRMNAYVQRSSPGMVCRTINTTIPNFDELGLPPVLKEVMMEKRGLVLMVGGTGSGKSTSLAAMLDHRNVNSKGHIISVEDPIEFVHPHKGCLVMQREVGVDTDSWFAALKNTLRQAPDVILIGEIRDRDTMDYAIAFAETGHLCLATLHANNSNQALDRIINFFPIDRRDQLLMDLSLNLKALVSQRLIPKKGGGRVPAVEIMINSPLISDLILKGDVHEIKPIMAKSRDHGMQTFDQALFDLAMAGQIERETALRYADSYNELRLMFKLHGGGEGDEDDKTKDLSIV